MDSPDFDRRVFRGGPSSPLVRIAFATCVALGLSEADAQTSRPVCATANPDVVLRDAVASKAAQDRLAAEFDPKMATIEPLSSERNNAERLWLDAKQAGKPAEEVKALRAQFDRTANAERDAARPLREALDRRKKEELDQLIKRINEIYKRLGTEQGFRLLLQNEDAEPAFVLDRGVRRSECKDPVNLTTQIIAELDKQSR